MSSSPPNLDDLRIDRGVRAGPPRSPLLWGALVALVLALAAGAWWLARPKPVLVRTVVAQAPAEADGPRTVLHASGYVTARREATVSSKITGKVTEILIEEGVSVSEGQVIARLDDTNVQASLRLAQAQRAAAEGALEETRVRSREAEQELRRQIALKEAKVSALADFDRAEASALALRARLSMQERELAVAERNIAVWQQQVEDTIIRAPFAGIVTSKNAQPGEMISPMSAGGGFTRTGIGTIVDMQSLEIEIDVNESYINRVAAGQAVVATLDAYPDWPTPCKVIAIIPTADRQKSTVRVRVGFDRLDPRILPEMAVKVAFQEAGEGTAAARTVTLPKQALHAQDGRDIVYVAHDGRAERRAVTVAQAESGEVVLQAGIAEGEKVIVEASAPLLDGVKIAERKP